MKYLFKRDTFLATLSVFLVMGILSLIPLNTHILDPLKLALTDISFNDLSFTSLKDKRPNHVDNKIIMVNIGDDSREEIAQLITKLGTYDTKAIGLDVLFLSGKEAHADSLLASAIHATPNIVLTDFIDWESKTPYQQNFFRKYAAHSGFVNFVGEDKGVIRYFSPREKIQDSIVGNFAAEVSKVADEDKFMLLQKRGKQLELINYKRSASQFFVLNSRDIVNDNVNPSLFKSKIIIVGYINNDPFNIEDKHFTPLNEKFVGKSIPDMNGAVIQANIVSMILDNDYIARTPWWLNWGLAFLFTWLFIGVIIVYYIEKHLWFHIVAKSIQLILTVLFVYIGIVCTKHLHVSINFTPILVAILLSVDVIIFFEGITHWLHRKFGHSTIFIKSHHS